MVMRNFRQQVNGQAYLLSGQNFDCGHRPMYLLYAHDDPLQNYVIEKWLVSTR